MSLYKTYAQALLQGLAPVPGYGNVANFINRYRIGFGLQRRPGKTGSTLAVIVAAGLLLGMKTSFAGEDITFSKERDALCNEIQALLIEKLACNSEQDCSRREILFCSPGRHGISFQLWGVLDYDVLNPVLQAATRAFVRRNGEMRVYIHVYTITKHESLSRPMSRIDPKFAEFVFKGSK